MPTTKIRPAQVPYCGCLFFLSGQIGLTVYFDLFNELDSFFMSFVKTIKNRSVLKGALQLLINRYWVNLPYSGTWASFVSEFRRFVYRISKSNHLGAQGTSELHPTQVPYCGCLFFLSGQIRQRLRINPSCFYGFLHKLDIKPTPGG